MRSFRSSGSVEGVMGNRHPYSDLKLSGNLDSLHGHDSDRLWIHLRHG
jgi:hypothetical protein